jgi:hypothetical protein
LALSNPFSNGNYITASDEVTVSYLGGEVNVLTLAITLTVNSYVWIDGGFACYAIDGTNPVAYLQFGDGTNKYNSTAQDTGGTNKWHNLNSATRIALVAGSYTIALIASIAPTGTSMKVAQRYLRLFYTNQ